MSRTMIFDRSFVELGRDLQPDEKEPGVLASIEFFMKEWGYSFGELVGAQFSTHWLGEGDSSGRSPGEMDLVIEMNGSGFFEIVLRSKGRAVYGGWLEGMRPIVVSDEEVNGHRVVLTTLADGSQLRHEYLPGYGYGSIAAAAAPLRSLGRMVMRQAS